LSIAHYRGPALTSAGHAIAELFRVAVTIAAKIAGVTNNNEIIF